MRARFGLGGLNRSPHGTRTSHCVSCGRQHAQGCVARACSLCLAASAPSASRHPRSPRQAETGTVSVPQLMYSIYVLCTS